uniref:Uncharacterized protein n=1 Tax=Arundo donax TaxID=35708 RepID=A0A0A9CJS1_ARUDO
MHTRRRSLSDGSDSCFVGAEAMMSHWWWGAQLAQ